MVITVPVAIGLGLLGGASQTDAGKKVIATVLTALGDVLRTAMEGVQAVRDKVAHALDENNEDGADGEGETCEVPGITEGLDMADPTTWPSPPGEGPFTEGEPSRSKPRKRGEKSLYDKDGGEYRPHKPDKHHDDGHWDYKPPGKNTPWTNIDP